MSDEAPLTTSNKISDEQWIVVYVLTISSASLSLLGSSAIVFKIMRDGLRKTTSYDRIILGLSSCDIISSIVYAIDQFLYPINTYAWAFGNQTTCQALGFLKQTFSHWAIWYNGILSFYFLFTVISQKRRRDYVRKLEPWMHLSGVFFPITAIMGLRRGWYGKNNICWISDTNILWIVSGYPVSFTYVAMIINYSTIYIIVRKSLKASEHIAGPPTLEQKRLEREATTMMFLYVASFFVTVSPTVVQQVLSIYFGYTSDNDSKIYAVWVLISIFLPLQGFINFFIYLKPAYTRFRASNPNKPMHFVLHQALFNPSVPEMNYLSGHSASDVVASELHLNYKGHPEENENDINTNKDAEEEE